MEVVKKRRTRRGFSLTQYFVACPASINCRGKEVATGTGSALTPQFASGLVARRAMANYAKLPDKDAIWAGFLLSPALSLSVSQSSVHAALSQASPRSGNSADIANRSC
jgi:hypothetical protein